MNVRDLIANLANYAAQSPENRNAEVMLRFDGDVVMEFGDAKDMRGMSGYHFLVFEPNESGARIGVREFKAV